ncbi:MAG: hypothetical protein HXS46_02230 [Theionarchaea archaeon]|nr:hypothetical protein [Theionarchaea archaeon]
MLRTGGYLVILFMLFCTVPCGHVEEGFPVYIEETEQLTEDIYDMIIWWNPFIFEGNLWLVYGELTPLDIQHLYYRIYDGEWSSSFLLSEEGEFVAAVADDETLALFYTTLITEELEVRKNVCYRLFDGELSVPVCTESESYIGSQFITTGPDGKMWLLWNRRQYWEYQVFSEGQLSEKQVLITTEQYDQILHVLPVENELWIFYETGGSDIYYRALSEAGISEPYPLVTEGFPYLYGAVFTGQKVMVFLEVQEAGTDEKILTCITYDGQWGPLEALATPDDGYLTGGELIRMPDGRVFVFWVGTEDITDKPWKVDIHYRVYGETWSAVYTLTDTPDMWETSPTVTVYDSQLVIVWKEKESQQVYASYARVEEGTGFEESGEFQQVTPKVEPEKPTSPPLKVRIKKYLYLIPMGSVLVVLAVIIYLKKRKSSGKEPERRTIGERRRKT